MARFDIYETNRGPYPLVIDVQAGLLSELGTRVVIPLAKPDGRADQVAPRLYPVITIDGTDYLLMTSEVATRPVRAFKSPVGNIEAEHRDTITAAMDFLFQGY
ncbi:CcdB family protein [Maricaulis sp.]|uniref:CcdB family protein n=1 Tax=Maricaulis sp. TaxID=1486257 RepID=UPI002630265C|nr:CcdB family protein [Maricaulis sp.]